MLKIAITQPFAVDGEDAIIRHLLANGFDIVHLRKPDADIGYCRELLQRLTHSERKRVVIHDYYSLYAEFNLRGIHLNKNIASYPVDYQGTRTRSCHSFDEVVFADANGRDISPEAGQVHGPDIKLNRHQNGHRKCCLSL